jgi:hypothetical protein
MMLRNAAAFALVGRYLMIPPWASYGKFDADAPLSRWKQSNAYDSAAECEQDRATLINFF